MAYIGQEQEQLIKLPFETSKITFNLNDFLHTPTVGYLTMCNLNRDAMDLLLNIRERLNCSCAKYLIDCWNNGLYKWDDTFMDKPNGCYIQLIHFACKYWCEEAVLYVLDIYNTRNLNLERFTSSKDK